MNKDEFVNEFLNILDDMQSNIFNKALKFREENTLKIDDKDEFYKIFKVKNDNKPKIHGAFVYSHWCGSEECEAKIKEDLKVTIRAIPFDSPTENGKCIYCAKESKRRVLFAKSY